MPAGQKLKSLRKIRNVTVREVEQASQRIAEAKGDKRFRISNGWLAQLEKGVSEPSICKLFSLSVIYHVKFVDLIRLYDVDIDEVEKYEPVANPQVTQLLSKGLQDDSHAANVPRILASSLRKRGTSLIPGPTKIGTKPIVPELDRGVVPISYGYVGLNDFTMYPLIWPGSFVWLDVGQNNLHPIAWHNEYERPIYFIELRHGYACGWCELHGNQLLIIPHHSSPATIRRFTYPKEAEIVGRVTGFETRCVGQDSSELIKEERTVRAKSTAG
ncbi:MAG: helix-turn-helix domain-containing protein [Pyrinomonadaceae bacterium]